jgi:HlyD family secretion protein
MKFGPSSMCSAFLAAAAVIVSGSCEGTAKKGFLGSAVMEARTCQASTTAQGEILSMLKNEGQEVAEGETLALIDTLPLVLRREELSAGIEELGATIEAKKAEIKSQESDLRGLEREFKRLDDLAAKGSVPAQQRDNLQTQVESVRLKITANKSLLASIHDRRKGTQARMDQLNDQISRCTVTAAAGGVVLTRYRNPGEVIAPGNPLYEIGRFDTLYADFFVPQPVLASLTYGQPVRLRIDFESPHHNTTAEFAPAAVTWISSEAEFSPKNIQTRESRNELVFRIRATAANPGGMLKRGLPVEVWR